MSDNPTEDHRTVADELIVQLLCQFHNPIPGPNAWLCRVAWLTYCAGETFDVDAVIAERLAYLNLTDHATNRANLVDCVEFLERVAKKKLLWELPDNPFDPSEWLAPDARPFTLDGIRPKIGGF